jgi:small subunit ribosomal protein S18
MPSTSGPTSRRRSKGPARHPNPTPCALCRDKAQWVDYKDVTMLRGFLSERGTIRAQRVTGNCAQHQREVATAIRTARELVLLPKGGR